MDGASRRRTTVREGQRPVQRTRRPARNSETEGERRRLIQLGVSVVLFLLVYVGRGIFPAQLATWQTFAAADVDFRAAFQQFGSALSQGEPINSALEALCVTLLGGEVKKPQQTEVPDETQKPAMVLLSQTGRGGMEYLGSHGILEKTGFPKNGDEPTHSEPDSSESEPESAQPAVVTAMAQEYTDDGVKLPRNVSFEFYELGLSETCVPVSGSATSGFGYRDSPIDGDNEFHLALDIGAEEGAEIGAFAAGTVEYIGTSDEFGNYLKISHENNVSSFYAHCSQLLVHKGDQVVCGQTVALVGHTGNATGSHLHLTIEKDNIRLDPAYYVDLS